MVVFTCNHCGDSLQKPKVAKHYETTCKRNPINLTCVDCFTDFKLQEYAVHTKCFTEEDRYSAKGTASKILKGEIKQTEWVKTVNTIIEQQINAKPGIKNILQALVNCDNIPRKKVKFLNFMKNAFGFKFNNRDIEQVWDLLEAHKNLENKSKGQKVENGNGEMKQEQEKTENLNDQEKKSKKKRKKSQSEEIVENGTNDCNGETKQQETTENLDESNKEKKSKKKKKKSEETTENGSNDGNEKIQQEPEVIKNLDESNQEKKSKKNKKKSQQTVENGTLVSEEIKEQEKTENLDESNQEKLSKKKKKKSESEETVETVVETNGVETSEEKTKKKRKSKQVDIINGAETPQKKQKVNETSDENEADTSSKKKKKRKSLQDDETPQKKQKTDETSETNGKTSESEETNNSKVNDSQNESFSFKQVILDILTKKSKGLSKEALQNKVFKKYEAIMGPIENKEILLKKYNKKLKAVKEITFDNDKYKLGSSSD